MSAVIPALSHRNAVVFISLFEWTLGLCLIVGKKQRLMLGSFVVVLAVFSLVLFRAKLTGFSGSCGCLGLAGSVEAAMMRNGGLMILALIAFFMPSSDVSAYERSFK